MQCKQTDVRRNTGETGLMYLCTCSISAWLYNASVLAADCGCAFPLAVLRKNTCQSWLHAVSSFMGVRIIRNRLVPAQGGGCSRFLASHLKSHDETGSLAFEAPTSQHNSGRFSLGPAIHDMSPHPVIPRLLSCAICTGCP